MTVPASRTCCVLLIIVAATMSPSARAIELTGRIAGLEGRWQRDPTRGIETCGSKIDQSLQIRVSEGGVMIESGQLYGLVRLDGSETTLVDRRTARASLDGGWLTVTVRRQAHGQVNVQRHVFILGRNELTIWTSLNVEYPDGSQGHIGCGSYRAIIDARQK